MGLVTDFTISQRKQSSAEPENAHLSIKSRLQPLTAHDGYAKSRETICPLNDRIRQFSPATVLATREHRGPLACARHPRRSACGAAPAAADFRLCNNTAEPRRHRPWLQGRRGLDHGGLVECLVARVRNTAARHARRTVLLYLCSRLRPWRRMVGTGFHVLAR